MSSMIRSLPFQGRTLALFAASLLVAPTAFSAPINYGDFSDIPPGAVMYTDVTESSGTDPVPLYGAPSIAVNNLDFDPMGFVSNSSDGAPGADTTDGQLNFSIMTVPTTGLNGLTINERGDFTLFGTGTAATAVGAGVIVSVDILQVDGVNVDPSADATVVGSVMQSWDLASNPGLSQFWSNSLFVDFGPKLASLGYGPNALVTKAEVQINDTLVSTSETNPNTTAFIAKKDFRIIPSGDLDDNRDIPEPTSAALVALGLAAAGVYRRR